MERFPWFVVLTMKVCSTHAPLRGITFGERTVMKRHGKCLTKPKSADTNDVQETLDLLTFITSILGLFDTFFANSPKTEANS